MRLPPPISGAFVVDTEVVPLASTDVDSFAAGLDAAMAKLAYGTLHRDAAILAYACIIESAFYWRGWRTSLHDESFEPVLDQIIGHYPDDAACDETSLQAMMRARQWWIPGTDYADLAGAIINVRSGKMAACRSHGGRVILYPASDVATELRNRWFDVLHFRGSEAAGTNLLKDTPKTRKIVRQIDQHVAKQDIHGTSRYTPPTDESWYRQHCDAISNGALAGQFAHVEPGEVWGTLNRKQIMDALRPLYRRAALRVFGHLRAFKLLTEKFGKPRPTLRSVVEVVRLSDLSTEVEKRAAVAPAEARAFVDSLVRRGSGEKHKLAAYPLIPMHGDRALLVPSTILFSNWPAAREQATARARVSAIGDARNERYTAKVVEILKRAGFAQIAKDVILQPPGGDPLTDLDVVAVSPACDKILVLQLKSFVTPSNIIDLRRADKNVDSAINQCSIADANLALTQTAIERALGISLAAGWSLYQAIVVEANTGTKAIPLQYPAVTIEWLESQSGLGTDPLAWWKAAKELPDAMAYFESVSSLFSLFDGEGRRLKVPQRAATFAYRAESYSTRNKPPPDEEEAKD